MLSVSLFGSSVMSFSKEISVLAVVGHLAGKGGAVWGQLHAVILWNAPPSQSTESMFGWNLSTSGWMKGTGRGVLRFHRTYRHMLVSAASMVGSETKF